MRRRRYFRLHALVAAVGIGTLTTPVAQAVSTSASADGLELVAHVPLIHPDAEADKSGEAPGDIG